MSNTKVTQLPPTLSIKDPDTRQFADALINVLDLRSGNTDKNSPERFITAKDFNEAISGGGGIGSGVGSPGGVIGGGAASGSIAGAIANLTQSIRNSLLDQLLRTEIPQVSAPEGLVESLRSDLQSQVNALGEGITQINTITETSDSFSAKTLYALKGTVEGPDGLPYAQAFIAQMDDVNVTSTHASVSNLRGLMSTVYDQATGLAAANSSIIELNKVDTTSTSALSQRVRAISSDVGVNARYFIQATYPISTTDYQIKFGDMWINTAASNSVYVYDGTQWVYSPWSRIGGSLSRIVTEENTRNTQTTALAQSVNTIWSAIGGDQALIQDGTLAAISPAAVQATKWTQVQAAVTDPNTGLVSSTSIKQDLNSYVSKVDGTMNASYTVRAQVVSGNRTIVGGFGLMATDGAGSDAGPKIDFGVNADTFWIGNTSGIGNYPFIVRTSPTYLNGQYVPTGVYINDAFITNGSIGTAKIIDGTITDAKIGNYIKSTNFDGGIDGNGYIYSNGNYGWAIGKSGKAVFNDVVLSRPNVLRTATYYVGGGVARTQTMISTPDGAVYGFTELNGQEYVFDIDTGYENTDSIDFVRGGALVAKVLAASGGWSVNWSSYPSIPFYKVSAKADVYLRNDWGPTGATWTGSYGRVFLRVTLRFSDVQQSIYSIIIGNVQWNLIRLT